MIEIVEANTPFLILKSKELFQGYAESLEFDLSFQNFDEEMDDFPNQYSPPAGRLMVAKDGNQIIGCVGLRKFDNNIGEVKRLYVKPKFRDKKAGRALAEAVIKAGKAIGYEYLRLDTTPAMERASKLYKDLGFMEIEPYRYNPIEGAIYMELDLKGL